MPGLVLLESARPGRNARWTFLTADPVAVLEAPSAGADPFAAARELVARLDPAASDAVDAADAPPFIGGLAGYLAYDLGHSLERLPTLSVDDQGLPLLRLALHDWAIAWDRRTGRAWLGGRALDGDAQRLDRRLADVREALRRPRQPALADTGDSTGLQFRSSLDRRAYKTGVEAIRSFIAGGAIYQANLTRRLETAFSGDPWPIYRRLRTGDPSLFSAFLDLGQGKAIMSGVAGAIPGRRSDRPGQDRPDQGHPTAGQRRAMRTGRSHANSSPAARTGPRT